MRRLYFPLCWMNRYYIVSAVVLKETRTKYIIQSDSQKMVFGKYAYLQTELDKKFFSGFETIPGAVSYFDERIKDDFQAACISLLAVARRGQKAGAEFSEFLSNLEDV